MKEGNARKTWSKTSTTNLYLYSPSGTYYLRARINGKLVCKTLGTDKITTARTVLPDVYKREARRIGTVARGRNPGMTLGEAAQIFLKQLETRIALKKLKANGRKYHVERLNALSGFYLADDDQPEVKQPTAPFPNFKTARIARITEKECEDWAKKFAKHYAPTSFNHTLSILRKLMAIASRNVLSNRNCWKTDGR